MMSAYTPTARPVLAGVESEVDVVVIGAGAAGIAAARRSLELGWRVAVIEARARVGGRAVTVSLGGHPVDMGAHWLHAGALNPLVRLGQARREPLRRAPADGHFVMNGAFGHHSDRGRYGRAFDRADAAFARAAKAPADRSLEAVLPALGLWRAPVAATLALISGRPLSEVSVKDFPSDEFGDNWFVRGGYGAFLARLAGGLPVALGRPVERLDWSGAGVVASGGWGEVRARAAVVTLPIAVLATGLVRFTPTLPDIHLRALSAFLPGTYEHVVLNWPDSPFRAPDRLAKLVSGRDSFGMLTRIDGAPFHYLELDHARVRSRDGRDPFALARLARALLAEQFGHRAISGARVLATTDWVGDPWSRAAWAVAPPGEFAARDVLAIPVGDRIWFAGEANMRAMWGTVGGAWESGTAAAEAAHARLAASGPAFAPDGAH